MAIGNCRTSGFPLDNGKIYATYIEILNQYSCLLEMF